MGNPRLDHQYFEPHRRHGCELDFQPEEATEWKGLPVSTKNRLNIRAYHTCHESGKQTYWDGEPSCLRYRRRIERRG